jgi:hypothetical protein
MAIKNKGIMFNEHKYTSTISMKLLSLLDMNTILLGTGYNLFYVT